MKLINAVGRVLVTPSTLTEASKLLAQHGEPERSRFLDVPRVLVERHEEVVVASKDAVRNSEFNLLGLTDAALLEVVSTSSPLVTVDIELYLAASSNEPEPTFGFRHYQFP